MFKYFEFNLKGISLILLYLLPITLLTGPAIPDISITIIGIFFIINSIIRKELEWLSEKWIISGLALWTAFILISFFAIDIKNSLQNAIIFIRYVMFSAAVSYWLLKERKQFIFFLQILSITLIFIIFDCFYQLINYNSLEGFGKDIFGFTSNHYGRLSGPFNDDVAGAHISRFLFFTILLFLLKRNNFYLNDFTFIVFVTLSSYIIWLSGEAMAIATTFMGIFIYIIIIKEKKYLIIFASLISIFSITLTNKFHSMNNDFSIISSTSYHHGLIINKTGECKNLEGIMCSKLIKTNPEFYKVISNFNNSIYYKIYQDALLMWSDNLFTGVGLGNYESTCLENIKYRSEKINYGNCSSHPHNIYIQSLSETGLLGSLFFIIFIFTIFFKILKKPIKYNNKISLINFCILFWPIMSTGSLLKNWYGIEFFLVIGLLLASIKINLNQPKPKF